jgi:plasmid stabilization system protein ParE
MAYRIKIMPRAERELATLYEQINAEQSGAAVKWYRSLKTAILSLEESPNRCPVTPENSKLRHLLYGHKPHIFRVIYRVLEKRKEIMILHIRHGARTESRAEDSAPEIY